MTSRSLSFTAMATALLVSGGLAGAAQTAAPQAAAPQAAAPQTPSRQTPPGAAAPRPPAASLGPADATPKPPDAAGFIRRWLVLEPLPVPPALGETAIQALVKDARFAEPRTAMPAAGQRVTIGDRTLAWHGLDTRGYNLNLFHFAYALERPTSNVLFWTVTVVDAPREMPGVRLAIGSNAASVWWLNDEEVIGLYNDRQAVIDDGVSKRVTLKKGPNVIRAAIVNGGGATDFCARFLDEAGQPVKGFTTRLTAAGPGR